jgi:hypothetical protein
MPSRRSDARGGGGREHLARQESGQQHGVGKGERKLRKGTKDEPAPPLLNAARQDERRPREGRCGHLRKEAAPGELGGNRADQRQRYGGQTRGEASQDQQSHQRDTRGERPAPGESHPDPGHRRSDAELQAEDRGAGYDPRRPADRAAEGEREQDQPPGDPCRHHLARREPTGNDEGADRLHRLHRQWQTVDQAGRQEEGSKAHKHPTRGHPRDGDRAEQDRQQGAEVADGAADLACDGRAHGRHAAAVAGRLTRSPPSRRSIPARSSRASAR